MTKNKEPVAFAEVGSYLHENKGNAKVKTYTSVNEPIKTDSAERTRQIGKVRVEMHIVEDKTVKDNQIYEKDVKVIQTSTHAPGGIYPQDENGGYGAIGEEPRKNGFSSLLEEKFREVQDQINNLSSNQRAYLIGLFGAIILAAIALGMIVAQ